MNTKMEHSPAINPNQILSVEKNGTVLYSNEAGELLLREWGVSVGEKLPSYIGDVVQRVLCQNCPERMEVKTGKRTYLIALHPSPKEECVNIYGFDISDQKDLEVKHLESEALEIAYLELSDIIDIHAIKPLMDDLYKLVHIPIGINDLNGNVLVGVGWQDICTKFHRVHHETCKHCIESDSNLSVGVLPGEFKLYKCKNNMYDIVTPIMVGSQHVGYVFGGQFFFEDEPLDYELFRSQARKYGFNEEDYIAALEKVPRLSREAVETGMSFFMAFANMLSQLNYSNIKLTKSLLERDTLLKAMRESEEKYRNIVETTNEGIWSFDAQFKTTYVNERMALILGYSQEEMIGKYPWEFINEETTSILKLHLEKRREGIDEVYEYKLICKDGSSFWAIINAKSLFNPKGNFTGSLCMFTDITERKRAEEDLKLTQSSVELASDNILWITANGKVIYANNATCKSMKYSRDELQGMYVWDFDPIYTKEVWLEHWLDIKKRGSFTFESLHHAKDGREFPVEVSVNYVRSGDMEFNFAYIKEITERKKAEEALKNAHENLEKLVSERTAQLEKAYKSLKKSEEGFAEAQKIAHIGNWEWDIVTGKTYWSDELYRIYGRNPKEPGATYDELFNYIHPDDRDYVAKAIKAAFDGKSYGGVDYRIKLANGEERTLYAKSEVIFDEENIPILVKGTNQDITERKRAEEKLLESEEKYRNIVETANEGIGIIDNEFKINYVNKKIEDMIDYRNEEIIGKSMWDFISEESKPIVKMILEKELEKEWQGLNESLEIKYIRKDGSPVWAYVSVKSLFDKDSKFLGLMTMLTDITKRKEAEEALEKIEIARKKEIHHRIKNNLQVISSLLDLQAEKLSNREYITDSEVQEAFRESQNRVISMALIHEELHKGEEIDTINFSQYIDELTDNLFLTYRLGNDGISLDKVIDENIRFDMDTSVPLGIIVNELVSNSLKYAFVGRDNGEIRVQLLREESESSEGSLFTLIVSDNGIGIPDNIDIEDLDSLGLQLVTTLVNQLDGELELDRDNGTEFVIRFTVAEKNNQSSAPAAHQPVS